MQTEKKKAKLSKGAKKKVKNLHKTSKKSHMH